MGFPTLITFVFFASSSNKFFKAIVNQCMLQSEDVQNAVKALIAKEKPTFSKL